MSRLKKNNEYLSSGSITERDMLAYLQGELSATEKQQFEKLLADDPFAQDALEGLQASGNAAAVTAKISGINHRIRQKTGAPETKTIQLHWTTYAYAAVVFGVLVGISFLIIRFVGDKNKELALNKETAVAEQELFMADSPATPAITETISDISVTDSVSADKTVTAINASPAEPVAAISQKNTTVISEDLKTKSTDAGKSATGTTAPAVINSTVVANAGAGAAPASTQSQSYKPTQVQSAAEVAVLEKANARSKAEGVKTKQTTEADETKKAAAKDAKETEASGSVDDAMKSFNSADYKTASEQFDAVLKNSPDNAEALYFGGISDYLSGRSAKSEKSFDRLIKTSRYTEGSKWYKANLLLKKGKKDEAVKLLNDLAGTSGMYKERAVKKLEEVK